MVRNLSNRPISTREIGLLETGSHFDLHRKSLNTLEIAPIPELVFEKIPEN